MAKCGISRPNLQSLPNSYCVSMLQIHLIIIHLSLSLSLSHAHTHAHRQTPTHCFLVHCIFLEILEIMLLSILSIQLIPIVSTFSSLLPPSCSTHHISHLNSCCHCSSSSCSPNYQESIYRRQNVLYKIEIDLFSLI